MKRSSILIITVIILAALLAGCQGSAGDADNSQAAVPAGEDTPAPPETDDSGGAEPTAAPAEEQQPAEERQSAGVEILVELPDGWAPVEGSVLEHQYMKNTASFMLKTENFSSGTLDEVVSEALSMYESFFDDVQAAGEAETITVDGIDARKLTFTCAVSGMDMKYTYVYLFAGGETYVLTFGDLADSFDSLASDYEAIINTIQFNQ